MQRILKPSDGWRVLVFAFLLLLVQAGALAHELRHQLQNPDSPCSVCLFSEHSGKTPITAAFNFIYVGFSVVNFSHPESSPRLPACHVFAARAPPAFSEI